MNVLVDSSVWIDYFRGALQSEALDELLDNNAVCTCGLILAEIIPFLVIKKEKELIGLLNSVQRVESAVDWNRIAGYQTTCLKNGINGVGIPDLIILQTSIDCGVRLFSLDKHFSLIKKRIPFELFLS